MGKLSFLTINVNGCRGVEKRFKLIEYLKTIPSVIIFLQETHSLEQDETFWKRAWRGKLIFSHFLSNSCGVAILIRPNMSFDLRFVKHIVKGRCIHLCIAIKDVVYDIVNVYAPSGDGTQRSNFYTTVREYVLQNIGQNVTVMTGDFNCTLNPKYDRASQVESHKHSANLLRDLVKELCITDCYRYVSPTTRIYKWHNIRSFARLDRIYVSTFLKSHIQCITNTPCPISDHDNVNAVFCLPSASRKKSYWKLNVSILEDVKYIHLVHQFWEFWTEKNQVFQIY